MVFCEIGEISNINGRENNMKKLSEITSECGWPSINRMEIEVNEI